MRKSLLIGKTSVDASAIDGLRPSELFSLRGMTAVVTGAAGGIGRWLSAGLGAAGANVVITDRDEAGLASLRQLLDESGIPNTVIVADLLQDGAIEEIVRGAVEAYGSFEVLVNNAGLNQRMPILEVDDETFDTMMRVDFRVPYFLARAAAKVFIDHDGGSIINMSSINNKVGLEKVSVLGPAKAALSQLTKVMAVEWSRYGIRVNCIAPGFLETPINKAVWQNPERTKWILDRVPMKRPGYPGEIVGLCVMLASEGASFISGQTYYVDGGFLSGSRWDSD